MTATTHRLVALERPGYAVARRQRSCLRHGTGTHTHAFIHTDNIKARTSELFGDHMHFDIIGDPPYQRSDGGNGTSASPINQRLAEKALGPRFVVSVTPSPRLPGGKGPAHYHTRIVADHGVRSVVDNPKPHEAVPAVNIGGRISYFPRRRDYGGPCSNQTIWGGEPVGEPTARWISGSSLRLNAGVSSNRFTFAIVGVR